MNKADMVLAFMELVVWQGKSRNYSCISINQMIRIIKGNICHELPVPQECQSSHSSLTEIDCLYLSPV